MFFLNVVHDLLNSHGINPFIATRIEEYLQSINKVTDIHVESKATPLGTSRIGELVNILLNDINHTISHDIDVNHFILRSLVGTVGHLYLMLNHIYVNLWAFPLKNMKIL